MKFGHRRIIKICRRLGIPLGLGRSDGWYLWSWDGRKLDVRSRFNGIMGKRPYSDSMHDIAHWLLCSEKRKLLPEFGLGMGVDSRSRPAELVVSYYYAAVEEELASLLGMLMERASGANWKETWLEHHWDETGISHYRTVRRRLGPWLEKRGHSLHEILGVCR